jgi:hypothetical protein
MTSEIMGDAKEGGQFGRWDVYPLFVQEAGRIADRRQLANTLFLSINSLFIGAIAILAQQSGFASVRFLFIEIAIAIAGLFITREWWRTLNLYRRLLSFRYEKLRALENSAGFPGAIKMYQAEADETGGGGKRIFGFSAVEESIPRLFTALYIASTVLLLAGTVAVRLNFSGWLSQFITIPTLK